MNLQQLEYIIAVDQFRNFSKAAEHCFVTQATLSTMVKKLEQELNLVLFDRKSNPVITTDCGQEIIEEAKKILYHQDRLTELAKTVKNKISGKIKIGVIPTISSSLMPLVIKPVMAKYPELELEVFEETTDQIIQRLKSGQLDMGIAVTPLEQGELEERILYYETLMVYGNTNFEKQYFITEELKNQHIWLFEDGHCLGKQTAKVCGLVENKSLPEHIRLHINSFDMLLNMVDQYGGLTLIPELFEKTLSAERKQKVGIFNTPAPVREVSLIYHRPFAKFRLIDMLHHEIHQLIAPLLRSHLLKSSEMVIIDL